MPTKKPTKATAKKSKDSEADNVPEDSHTSSSQAKETPSGTLTKDVDSVSTPETDPKDSGQLFFSTDGSEPEKKNTNPYEEKPVSNESVGVDDPNQSRRTNEGKEMTGKSTPSHSQPKPQHPNQQRQGKKNFKKQNWQDNKNPNKKPRPKFKKPRKLPYEDTESKPLLMGNLLESEALKTEEGLTALAEEFAGSDNDPINFNELYGLALPELKEKVLSLSLEIEMPPAPIREEIFDLLFDTSFKNYTQFKSRLLSR